MTFVQKPVEAVGPNRAEHRWPKKQTSAEFANDPWQSDFAHHPPERTGKYQDHEQLHPKDQEFVLFDRDQFSHKLPRE